MASVSSSAHAANMDVPPLPNPPMSLPSRRRRSPPSSLDTRPKRHPPNQTFVAPASPQVISSLIDSLSAISGPARDHFESVPAVNGRRPSATSSLHEFANGTDAGSHRSSRDVSYVYLEDAAEPPVVRTSKPPSGLSPITAPKAPKKERTSSLRDNLGSAAQSSTSLCSARPGSRDRDDASSIGNFSIGNVSIGNVSIEAGPRPEPTPAGSSTDNKRSSRGHRSLMYMSSREKLRNRESERRRLARVSSGPDILIKPDDKHLSAPKRTPHVPSPKPHSPVEPFYPPPSPPPGPPEFFAEAAIEEAHEEPASPPTPSKPPKIDTKGKSPMREGRASDLGDAPRSPTAGSSPGFIPERQSSLRHQSSSGYKKMHSRKSSKNDRWRTKPPIEEETSSAAAETNEPDEFEGVETETTKRIRELKKQKQLRDRKAGKPNVAAEHAGESPGVSHVSPVQAPPSPPTSSDSSMSERPPHEPSRKAHKILGLAYSEPFTPPQRSSLSPERALDMASSKERPSVSPKTPKSGAAPTTTTTTTTISATTAVKTPPTATTATTPKSSNARDDSVERISLPINYQLAIKTLARQSSTPSTKSVNEQSDSGTTQSKGSKMSTVGGRSALSRKHSSTLIMPVSIPQETRPPPERMEKEAPRTELLQKPLPPRRTSLQSTPSPEHSSRTRVQTQDRHQSLQMSSPVRKPSTSEPRGRNKKRWSHPDLHSKAAEQDKVLLSRQPSHHSHAVKSPPVPMREDRPTSADSIDIAVDHFLDAPRLSHKVRHPQSGRIISFSEVGDPKGYAVFCCVGMGLTRYVMAFYDELALTLKLRLITPDRPGIGGSQGDENVTPLAWTDDIITICQKLRITKFSLLAHSAGAVYALATALRMPQHIRGRVHLLAPWIPPSQMAPIGVRQNNGGGRQLPRSQRFLRVLPPSFLKIANSSFLSATSASITRSIPKSPQNKRRSVSSNNMASSPPGNSSGTSASTTPNSANGTSPHGRSSTASGGRPSLGGHRDSMMTMDQIRPKSSALSVARSGPGGAYGKTPGSVRAARERLNSVQQERREIFDERLTVAIWERATANANPATDLIVCLETRHTIGFRYEDITRGVVIHHGSKDSRVPVDNVRWLGRIMRRCEVRILEGEAHGLMANPIVMGNLLMEIAKEWEDWNIVVEGSRDRRAAEATY